MSSEADVLEHLGRVIDRVVSEKPADAYRLLEVMSRLVKESAVPKEAPVPTEEENAIRSEYSSKVMQLNKVPMDEAGETVTTVCAIPDFMEEAELLSWGGVGFGDVESYKITCSLRNLAAKQAELGLTKIRFWGKIMGSEQDYFVAEAALEAGGDPPEDEPDMEAPGTGVNAYTYFVANDLSGEWSRLPDLKPREIIGARQIKRLVSGNLSAKVTTVPYFPGGEAVYLRAQIAQISADTVLCMGGYMAPTDPEAEDPEADVAENPEFAVPSMKKLRELDSWTHCIAHILKNGRTTHAVLEEADAEDLEAVRKFNRAQAEQDADPKRKLLRTLANDFLQWNIKQAGDDNMYKNPIPGAEGAVRPPKSYGVTCVRSLTWPGAVCVARGGQFTNLYVGYGIRANTPDFFLRAPLDVQQEPEDRDEFEEPCGEAAPEGGEGEAEE